MSEGRGHLQRATPAEVAAFAFQEIYPDSPALNLCFAATCRAAVDQDIARRAWAQIIARHEVLRSSWHRHDASVRRVVRSDHNVVLEVVPAKSEVTHAITAFADRPFEMGGAPPHRLALVEDGSGRHIVALAIHHIAADAHSVELLMREFDRTYSALSAGEPLPNLVPEMCFADHGLLQEHGLAGPDGERARRFWRDQLDGLPPPFPLGGKDSATFSPPRHESMRVTIDSELGARIAAHARSAKATPAMLVLTAFQCLLSRHFGARDFAILVPSAGRRRADVRERIGLFANPLPIRFRTEDDLRFDAALRQTRSRLLRALENDFYPYAAIVEAMRASGVSPSGAISSVMFSWNDSWAAAPEEASIFSEILDVSGQRGTAQDLMLTVRSGDTLSMNWTFDAARIEEEAVRALAGALPVLLDAALEAPGTTIASLPLLSEPDRAELFAQWTGPQVVTDGGITIADMFEAQAARTPERVALVQGARTLSYRALEARADAIARAVAGHGAQEGEFIGILMARESDMVAAMLAVLKVGAAYVPLDPSYPPERLAAVIEDSGVGLILKSSGAILPETRTQPQALDVARIAESGHTAPKATRAPSGPAYMIYTSGSTGKPKGVIVSHRNLVNLFAGLELAVGEVSPPGASWIAHTSISFDISQLELLWTLCRGDRVILHSGNPIGAARLAAGGATDFSLFFFPSETNEPNYAYSLLKDGARIAEAARFEAIWTPERHFHSFGADYPNPAIAAATVAATTSRIGVRAGSVVLPLHDPIRVAEDWAMVDRLSGGRVGLSFAPGWNPDDFVLAPDRYADRRNAMAADIEIVHRLWRGESVTRANGTGRPIDVAIRPRPVQAELPTWLTVAGSPESFELAGRCGWNLLTHMLGQNLGELSRNIERYRRARAQAKHDRGHVTLMLHTFIGADQPDVRHHSEAPFKAYLRSSFDLMRGLATEVGLDMERDAELLIEQAYHRYSSSSALLGSAAELMPLVERLRGAGVDEFACLVDFGIAAPQVVEGLHKLAALAEGSARQLAPQPPDEAGVEALILREAVTHMQCTPSLLRGLLATDAGRRALGSLKVLLCGGETFPAGMAEDLAACSNAVIFNMYGPTETTVWSAVRSVGPGPEASRIGPPIANTRFYVLDDALQPVLPGRIGELHIGGDGVASGYWQRPDLTADRFRSDPFLGGDARIYGTGDLVSIVAPGSLDFHGRRDDQVKVRGVRVELGEVEAAILAMPEVAQAVVTAAADATGATALTAHLVLRGEVAIPVADLHARLTRTLPAAMLPSRTLIHASMPLTSSGKIDRQALFSRATSDSEREPRADPDYAAPGTALEERIRSVWRELLGQSSVGLRENFFHVGGHSLLALDMVEALMREGFGQLHVGDIFAYPTISELARRLSLVESDDSIRQRSQERAMMQRNARRRRSPAVAEKPLP